MIFRKFPQWRKSNSKLEQFTRVILFGLVMALVVWGFSTNNQRKLDAIHSKKPSVNVSANVAGSGVWDETNTLTDRQLADLDNFVRDFASSHNVRFVISINTKSVHAENPGGGEIFFNICPAESYVSFKAPPLITKALGADLVEDLNERHFIPYFKQNRWPDGLAAALYKINLRFEE